MGTVWVRYGTVWVRYGYGYGYGIWYMVLALGRTKDIRHGTRMEYIYHEGGGDGRMLKVHTEVVFKKAF